MKLSIPFLTWNDERDSWCQVRPEHRVANRLIRNCFAYIFRLDIVLSKNLLKLKCLTNPAIFLGFLLIALPAGLASLVFRENCLGVIYPKAEGIKKSFPLFLFSFFLSSSSSSSSSSSFCYKICKVCWFQQQQQQQQQQLLLLFSPLLSLKKESLFKPWKKMKKKKFSSKLLSHLLLFAKIKIIFITDLLWLEFTHCQLLGWSEPIWLF